MSSFDECLPSPLSRRRIQPATDPTALPPQFGFRRWFADRCSRTVELDRSARRGFARSSRTADAVRRLLQPDRFASTTVDDPNPAHHDGSRLPTQLLPRVAGAETPLSKRSALGQPRLHGPGVDDTGENAQVPRRLPTRSLAPRAVPRPAGLEHLMSQARALQGWSCPASPGYPLPAPVRDCPNGACKHAPSERMRQNRSSREGCPGPHSAKNEASVHTPRCFPPPEDPC